MYLCIFHRYLFKKALLEDELARTEIMARKEQAEIIQEEDVQWEKGKSIIISADIIVQRGCLDFFILSRKS